MMNLAPGNTPTDDGGGGAGGSASTKTVCDVGPAPPGPIPATLYEYLSVRTAEVTTTYAVAPGTASQETATPCNVRLAFTFVGAPGAWGTGGFQHVLSDAQMNPAGHDLFTPHATSGSIASPPHPAASADKAEATAPAVDIRTRGMLRMLRVAINGTRATLSDRVLS
ncbi:MAG: hypothetical protein E6J85_05495 [Deltaproteobacteria bacterium]|nr:MAG: hypothetical protein E6J85_05495 [Deltaproteobacteria bacterium]